MNDFFAFLKYRSALLLFYICAVFFVWAVPFLTGQRMEFVAYTICLVSFSLFVILLFDGARFFRRRRALAALRDQLTLLPDHLPEPGDALETEYCSLLRALGAELASQNRRLQSLHRDQLSYYTLWVHQIKTPIAAMRLVLQETGDETDSVLRQELFKIEQYADLALRYVKLNDISVDLIVERCDVGAVVHESVKKFALLFVYQKLSVELSPIDAAVVTDKRWLAFIIEQVLSNAVKYTKSGGVNIEMRGLTLTIRDTGIGIRAEDLPRIFEQGYTGYNGRMDARASGIGLFLARKAADPLGIKILVQSSVGTGTAVSLRFPDPDTKVFS